MRAWMIDRYGKAAPLVLRDLPDPTPGPDDVVVRLRAASVNPVDFKIREGKLRAVTPYPLPLVLGNDGAGEVIARGERVRGLAVGDEVYLRADKDRIGTFAERIVVRASSVARRPAGISAEEAAALPLVGLTSWQALFDRGGVREGSRVFIPAGSGGVGSVAIQLAKARGAWVATNTSAKNVEWVRGLGADEVIDYGREDFATRLRDLDVVYDTMGGETQRRAFATLRPGGLLVSIVGPPTAEFARAEGLGVGLRLAMWAMSLGARRAAARAGARYEFLFMRPDGGQLAEIARLVEAGRVRPIVDRVYGFDEAPAAIAHVEGGRARGKVVIRID